MNSTTKEQLTKERLIEVVKGISLPEGQWVLNGSSVLLLHGINPRPVDDIDLFCSTRTWFLRFGYDETTRLVTTDPNDPKRRCDPPFLRWFVGEQEINLFFSWRIRGYGDFDANQIIRDAVEYDGIPCVSLEAILDWKDEVKREKDIVDVEAIKKYIES